MSGHTARREVEALLSAHFNLFEMVSFARSQPIQLVAHRNAGPKRRPVTTCTRRNAKTRCVPETLP